MRQMLLGVVFWYHHTLKDFLLNFYIFVCVSPWQPCHNYCSWPFAAWQNYILILWHSVTLPQTGNVSSVTFHRSSTASDSAFCHIVEFNAWILGCLHSEVRSLWPTCVQIAVGEGCNVWMEGNVASWGLFSQSLCSLQHKQEVLCHNSSHREALYWTFFHLRQCFKSQILFHSVIDSGWGWNLFPKGRIFWFSIY